jgi:L-ascorbate metabolism protein UlaG (beta-lactamase superfamily)
MKITKYEHACWVMQEGQSRVIVDPGIFSKSITNLSNVNAVVITHIHSDHLDPELINKIIEQNPTVQIYSTSQVAKELEQKVVVPELSKKYKAGNLELEFFGEKHHLFGDIENLAVLVSEQLFVPGDSYTQPNKPVTIAAVPASAPWLRIDEAKENIQKLPAKIVVPTHNALLSEIGESIHYRILSEAAKESGKQWKVLETGESIEL